MDTSSSSSPSDASAASIGDDAALISLGRRIAAARQTQAISLADLAGRLHLGVHQLEALESGDSSRLPEAVFVIAQARRVAASLDIDIEPELAALRSRAPRRAEGAVIRSGLEFDPASAHRRRGLAAAMIPAALGLGLLLAAVAAASLLRRHSIPVAPARSTAVPPPTQASPSSLPQRSASAKPEATAAQPAAASASPADVLMLSSTPASWISVRDRSGRSLYAGTLSGERRFPIGQGLEVLAGRPDLVQASLGDQPARPLGPISQVQWRSFAPAARDAAAPSKAP